MMKGKRTDRENRFICITLACWGLTLVTCGLIMNTSDRTIIKKNYSIDVSQKKIAEAKTNEIKTKDIIVEVNNPISVDVKDYLENKEEISISVIKALKLDTSNININQAGSYTYTISFKKKKYNGTVIVKEKELPKQVLTLKHIYLTLGDAVDTNIETYIEETLSEEVKNNIILDLSQINKDQAGEYKYSVTYAGVIHEGDLTINPQTTKIIPPEKDLLNKDSTKTS